MIVAVAGGWKQVHFPGDCYFEEHLPTSTAVSTLARFLARVLQLLQLDIGRGFSNLHLCIYL